MAPGQALAYGGIFIAAAVEGEAVFMAATVAVALGHLNAWAVLTAAALGGSAGDQFFFYAFRGALGRWLDSFPDLRRRREALSRHVHRYRLPMAAVCRFLPGLRIAIAAACACSGTSPFVFSSLSLASSFVWAGVIMGLVTWAGPSAMGALGLARGWALAVSIGVTLVVVLLLRRVTLTSED